jgi:TonB family protein
MTVVVTAGQGGAVRWATCFALVFGLHIAAVVALLRRDPPLPMALPPAGDAVLLDLAPAAPSVTAPEQPPSLPPEPQPAAQQADPDLPLPQPPEPQPPEPQPPEPQPPEPTAPEPPPSEATASLPSVEPEMSTPPLPAPEIALPPPRLPRPRPPQARPPAAQSVPKPAAPRPVTPQTPTADPVPVAPAAPASGAPSAPPSNAVPTWRSELMGKLLRAKRYPEAARARGEQGTAYATFTMDRGGRVLSARLAKTSGSYQLDDEAVALIYRAEPLPPLPAEMPGATATMTVPVAFALR